MSSFFEAYYPNVLEIQVIAKYDKLLELIDFKYMVEKKYNKFRIKNLKNFKHKIDKENFDKENFQIQQKQKRESEKINF